MLTLVKIEDAVFAFIDRHNLTLKISFFLLILAYVVLSIVEMYYAAYPPAN